MQAHPRLRQPEYHPPLYSMYPYACALQGRRTGPRFRSIVRCEHGVRPCWYRSNYQHLPKPPSSGSRHRYAVAAAPAFCRRSGCRFRRSTRRHAYERHNPHSRSSLLRPHHSNQKCADEHSASPACRWESFSAQAIPACSKRLCVYAPGLGMFFPS